MRYQIMPPDPYSVALWRSKVIFFALLGSGVMDFLTKTLVQNGVFVLIILLGFFGSLVPLVKEKAAGVERWFVRGYSAFYSFLVTSVVAALLFYGVEMGKYWVMLLVLLIGALMEALLNRLFLQVDATPDFESLLKFFLRMARLIVNIVKVAWQASDLPGEDKDKPNRSIDRNATPNDSTPKT